MFHKDDGLQKWESQMKDDMDKFMAQILTAQSSACGHPQSAVEYIIVLHAILRPLNIANTLSPPRKKQNPSPC